MGTDSESAVIAAFREDFRAHCQEDKEFCGSVSEDLSRVSRDVLTIKARIWALGVLIMTVFSGALVAGRWALDKLAEDAATRVIERHERWTNSTD